MFGEVNRWGRMPYTVYEPEWVNKTLMSQHDLTADGGRTHRYYTGKPVIKFGYGLSLTTFDITTVDLKMGPNTKIEQEQEEDHSQQERQKIKTLTYSYNNDNNNPQQIVDVTLNVTNTGNLQGDTVITAIFSPLSMPKQKDSKLLQNLF